MVHAEICRACIECCVHQRATQTPSDMIVVYYVEA